MTSRFLAPAIEEFDGYLDYYHQIDPRPAVQFRIEAHRLLELIVANPEMYRERSRRYRRANFSGFNFYIAYFIRGEMVLIAAISHSSRRPEHWIKRLDLS